MQSDESVEAVRLERLWAGDFGDAYTERNDVPFPPASVFWSEILETYPVRRVLEIGCNVGAHLKCLCEHLPAEEVYGVDINPKAIEKLHADLPRVNAMVAPARELPFRDGWFDLIFTFGVLMLQPDDTLPTVMAEIVRCSRRYVLCGEYHAATTTEVPYRGQRGVLIKRDFGQLYLTQFPQLRLIEERFLGVEWGDVTCWIFEKTT